MHVGKMVQHRFAELRKRGGESVEIGSFRKTPTLRQNRAEGWANHSRGAEGWGNRGILGGVTTRANRVAIETALGLEYSPSSRGIAGAHGRRGLRATGELDVGKQVAQLTGFERRPRHAAPLHLRCHGRGVVPKCL